MCLQHQVFGHNFLDRGPIQLKLVALCFVYIGLQQSKGNKIFRNFIFLLEWLSWNLQRLQAVVYMWQVR